jgi:hypothetical protein
MLKLIISLALVACVSPAPKACGPTSDLDFCAYDTKFPGSCLGGTCYRQCETIAGVDTCPASMTIAYTGDANFLCYCVP